MVQVLPYVQSPLEQLTPHISQGVGNIASGIKQHYLNKSDQQILSQLHNGDLSASNIATIWPKLSPEARKTYEPFLNSQIRIQEAAAKEEIKAKGAVQKAENEKKAAREEIQPAFKRLRDLLPYGGRWGVKAVLGKIPYTEASGKREELDQLGVWTADAVYTKFNKGTLAKVKWDDVKDRFAPNSRLSDRENEARIHAMETIMGLPDDVSADKLGSVIKNQEKKIESTSKKEAARKPEKGQKITEDIAKELLQAYGNDPEKARAAAKEMGYEF